MGGLDIDPADPGGNIVQRAKAYTRTVNAIPEYIDGLASRVAEFEQQVVERIDALETRFSTLEAALVRLQNDLAFLPQFASELDRIRPELAEIRAQLAARLDADAEGTELVGRLLQAHEARLVALEESRSASPGSAPAP